MTGSLVFGAVVLLLIIISVRERIRQRLHREKDWSFIGEGKASPLSEELTNLIGVAELIHLGGISLEPLAAVSIFTALVQPYLQRVLNAWRRL